MQACSGAMSYYLVGGNGVLYECILCLDMGVLLLPVAHVIKSVPRLAVLCDHLAGDIYYAHHNAV